MNVQARTSSCLVEIREHGGQGRNGTGFFAAPGLVITAGHVVDEAKGARGNLRLFDIEGAALPPYRNIRLTPEFDLALIEVEAVRDRCVRFGNLIDLEDSLWMQGLIQMPGALRLNPVLGSARGEVRDRTDSGVVTTLEGFGGGPVKPGMSGAPVVNLRTGLVCGVLVRTLDQNSPLGGLAVPARFILSAYPDLGPAQIAFHNAHQGWMLDGIELPGEPKTVAQQAEAVRKYPRGPAFPFSRLPITVMDAVATLDATASATLMARANALRIQCEPKPLYAPAHLLTVAFNPGMPLEDFWLQAWPRLAGRGPRMLAAVLYGAVPGTFDGQEVEMRELLTDLRGHILN